MAKNKKAPASTKWPEKAFNAKFKMLHHSEILTAKNGNQYFIMVIEIELHGRTQIQNIAFFMK